VPNKYFIHLLLSLMADVQENGAEGAAKAAEAGLLMITSTQFDVVQTDRARASSVSMSTPLTVSQSGHFRSRFECEVLFSVTLLQG